MAYATFFVCQRAIKGSLPILIKPITTSRLDFFLIDENLPNFPVCETNIIHGFSTDYSYISLNLQGSAIEKGMGYWKLNNSHLHDDEFVSKVNLIINETVNSSYDSYAKLWDVKKKRLCY